MPNFLSYYHHYANQSLKWLPNDTEQLYKRNLKRRHDELKKYGGIDADFTYDVNSYGFRSSEFTADPTVMFLGCSNTIGIGMPNDLIWPTFVSQKLHMRSANLGIGGSGPDTAFRMCLGYIDKINPKIVVHMLNPGIRFELVDKKDIDLVSCYSDVQTKLYEELFVDDNNYFFNLQKNTLAIKMLCAERNIKFIQMLSDDAFVGVDEITRARDLQHPGINEQKIAAEKILSKL